jgi:hypothetical protein
MLRHQGGALKLMPGAIANVQTIVLCFRKVYYRIRWGL